MFGLKEEFGLWTTVAEIKLQICSEPPPALLAEYPKTYSAPPSPATCTLFEALLVLATSCNPCVHQKHQPQKKNRLERTSRRIAILRLAPRRNSTPFMSGHAISVIGTAPATFYASHVRIAHPPPTYRACRARRASYHSTSVETG